MRILVTGGTGFLGRAFVRAAASSGHAIANLSRTAGRADPTPGVVPIPGHLSDPPWGAIAAFLPDAVLHAAWIATPGVYLDSPENVDWLQWSRAFALGLAQRGVRHLTVLGTCIEYAVTGQPMHEDRTPIAPVSPYARAKAGLHAALAADLAPTGTGLAWARLFYPYGPGEHPARLASSLLERLARNEAITLRTPGSTKDYIHEDDAARALLAIVESGHRGPVNVGTGEGVTIENFARTLAGLAGRPDLVVVPENAPPDRLDFVVADAARLRSLGWTPRIPLVDGLRGMVEARRG